MIGRVARVCGAMVDARTRTHTGDACELATAAGWIASNLLAARGVRVGSGRSGGRDAGIVRVRVSDIGGLLAAIAVVPALIDGSTLPLRWRLALRALGLPLLDRSPELALASGASVVVVTPRLDDGDDGGHGHGEAYEVHDGRALAAALAITVGADELGYRVRVRPGPRALVSAA